MQLGLWCTDSIFVCQRHSRSILHVETSKQNLFVITAPGMTFDSANHISSPSLKLADFGTINDMKLERIATLLILLLRSSASADPLEEKLFGIINAWREAAIVCSTQISSTTYHDSNQLSPQECKLSSQRRHRRLTFY